MLSSVEATPEQVEKTGLSHRVHLPADAAVRRTVLLVHGRAGTDRLMWTFSTCFSRLDPFTVAPQANLPDPLGGYSWWQVESENDQGTPGRRQTTTAQLGPALERLGAFVDALAATYGRDLGEIYALGFSQGAAMVASLSLLRPSLFTGVTLLAGFIPKIVHTDGQFISADAAARKARLPRYLIAHGSQDRVIPLDRAELARNFLEGLGAEVELHVDPVGHKVGSQGMKGLRAWFDALAE